MSRLTWDDRDYETGLDRGVFFPINGDGEVWNGLVSVQERSEELSSRVRYRDGVKVVNQRSEDSFSASVFTFALPSSFRPREEFGFSYRVMTAAGYKIHIVYNAMAIKPGQAYGQTEISPLKVDISTRPMAILGAKPSAHLIVDTSVAYSWALEAFEDILYGSDMVDSRLPSPEELVELFEVNSILRVIDHGDGTFTITGPDEAIQMLDDTTFQITWPSAVIVDEESYTIGSL